MQPNDFEDSGSEGETRSGPQRDPAMSAQDILSCIGDAIVSIDFAGRIAYLNPAAERMTGCSGSVGLADGRRDKNH